MSSEPSSAAWVQLAVLAVAAVAVALLLGAVTAFLPAPYLLGNVALTLGTAAGLTLAVIRRLAGTGMDEWLMGMALALPLGIHVAPSGLALGRPARGRLEGETVAVSAVVVGMWLMVAAVRMLEARRRVRARLWRWVALFAALNLVALSVGWLQRSFGEGLSSRELISAALLAAQPIVPLVAYLLVVNSKVPAERAARVLAAMMTTVGLWLLLQTWESVRTEGMGVLQGRYAEYVNLFGIRAYTVQYTSYWPTVVSILGVYLTALLLVGGPRTWFSRALLVTALVGVIAYQAVLGERRTAVLTLLFGCAGVGWAAWLQHQRRLGRAAVVLLLGLLITTVGGLASLSQTVAFVRFRYLFGVEGSRSVAERIEVLQAAAERVLRNPLVGSAYVPFDEGDPLERGILRIPSAHNFYVDLAQKAGVPVLVAYLVLLAVAARIPIELAHWPGDTSTRVLAVTTAVSFILVCLVANQFQNTFSQPYPAIVLWTMVGLCERARDCRQPTRS